MYSCRLNSGSVLVYYEHTCTCTYMHIYMYIAIQKGLGGDALLFQCRRVKIWAQLKKRRGYHSTFLVCPIMNLIKILYGHRCRKCGVSGLPV